MPLCSYVSPRKLSDEFPAFLRESGPGSRGRLAVRTWKSFFFNEPLVSDTRPMGQSTEVWKNSTSFYVNADGSVRVHVR